MGKNLPVISTHFGSGFLLMFYLSFYSVSVKAFDIGNESVLFSDAEINIRGMVVDDNDEPLIGVNIQVKGTNKGTTTDFDGIFIIDGVEESAVLVVSYIGFQTVEIEVEGRQYIEIVMKPDSQLLDEVVVVGYGSQSRETITGAISKIDERVLKNIPYPNVGSSLQGSLSGVRVQTTTGMPGAAPRIIIRGGTSINNPDGAAPLYV